MSVEGDCGVSCINSVVVVGGCFDSSFSSVVVVCHFDDFRVLV